MKKKQKTCGKFECNATILLTRYRMFLKQKLKEDVLAWIYSQNKNKYLKYRRNA